MKKYLKSLIVLIILLVISSVGFGSAFGYGDRECPEGYSGSDGYCYPFCITRADGSEFCEGVAIILTLTARTSPTCGGKVTLDWGDLWKNDTSSSYHIIRPEDLTFDVYKDTDYMKIDQNGYHHSTPFITVNGTTTFDVIASAIDYFTVLPRGFGVPSNYVSATPSNLCPFGAPTLSTTTISSCGGIIGLSWTAVLDAIRYKVFKNDQQVATSTDTSLEVVADSEDVFTVKAVSSSLDSPVSNSVSGTPSDICITAPILSVSTSISCGEKVSLSWTEVLGATGYKVFKNGEQITSTTGVYFEVIANPSDIFTVKAFSTIGESPVSNSVSARPSLICPLGLLTLEARTGDSCGEKVYLSWNDFTDAFQYKVFKNSEQVEVTTKTFFEITATPADIFTVRADLRSGESENSNPVSATPSDSCSCRGTIPNNGFERCPGTIISAENAWTLVSSCSDTNPGDCEYRATSGNIIEPPATTTVIIEEVISEVKKILESETGSVVTKVVTTVGVVSGGVAVTGAFASTAATDLFFLPFKLWGLLLSIFGLKRRNRPWGTVYDSVTKQPIDPAYVTLTNLDTKEENTSITDLDGRYGFLVSLGRYIISANKTNYTFPSKKLLGKTEDELYTNLYFGEELKIETDNALINKNIPLDPIKFDWNEFVKGKKKLMRFYSRRKKFLSILSDWLFRIGFVISAVSLFLVPAPYNLVIFFLYILLVILRKFGLKQKALGSLTERDGSPLSFAIIRVFDSELNVEITNKVADKIGRYYCLVSKGKYYVKVEKKNDDESYSIVHTSEIFEADGGIINKNFVV